MDHSEVIDCATHIKIIVVGAEERLLISHVQPHVPYVHVLYLPDQADKNDDELTEILADTRLLFITADIADPINQLKVERVVHAARERNVLVLGVPVHWALEATEPMLQIWYSYVDALLMGKLGDLYPQLQTAANEIEAIVNKYGYVNLDFEDVFSILGIRGVVRMGTSTAVGSDRAQRAALDAVQDIGLTQAKGLMMLVSGAQGRLRLSEMRQAMNIVTTDLPESAHVIFGAAYDDSLGDQLRVTVFVSGLPYPTSS